MLLSDSDIKVVSSGKDIPEQLHPICINCIKSSRKKYSGYTDDDGKLYQDGFDVNCSFIPHDENFVSPKFRKDLSPQEIAYVNALKSPLHWGEQNLIEPDTGLPWKAWPYQRGPLLCTSSRCVYRMGRRTGKTITLAVRLLWFIYTSGGGTYVDPTSGKIRQNLQALVLTPYKSQIANIFQRVRTFISLVPELKASKGKDVQGSPQEIGVKGSSGQPGNKISGFATGESSGNQGVSARGQDSDLIVMDEGAWISEDTIKNVINPILITRPTTKLVFSSTPSGFTGDYFQKLCEQRPSYKEFYFPTTSRPDWDDIKEEIIKDYSSSQEVWDKEILAKFSQAGEGVYRGDLVRLAQSDLSYGEEKPDKANIYTFGIDWNKEHGTEICILSISRKAPHICSLVFATNIPKKEFTTPSGIHRVVELNRVWIPDWIFVDAGGSDGAEMLQHHGLLMAGRNKIDARLMNIVEAYNFGSKIEVAQSNGPPKKFSAKPFMVENSVKMFEMGLVKYPREDTLLTQQLNNYIVKHRTQSNVPVYALKEPKWGDHRLDALNLALIAARLKFPTFWQQEFMQFATPAFSAKDDDISSETDRIILPGTSSKQSRNLTNRSITNNRSSQNANSRGWGTMPKDDVIIKSTPRTIGRGFYRRVKNFGR